MSDKDKTFHEQVSDGVLDFLIKAKTELDVQLPKPPGVRTMPEAEQLQVYDAMTPQKAMFIQKYGVAATENYFGKMEMLRLRRQRNANV